MTDFLNDGQEVSQGSDGRKWPIIALQADRPARGGQQQSGLDSLKRNVALVQVKGEAAVVGAQAFGSAGQLPIAVQQDIDIVIPR